MNIIRIENERHLLSNFDVSEAKELCIDLLLRNSDSNKRLSVGCHNRCDRASYPLRTSRWYIGDPMQIIRENAHFNRSNWNVALSKICARKPKLCPEGSYKCKFPNSAELCFDDVHFWRANKVLSQSLNTAPYQNG
jgi:hypothetical protein